MNIFDLIEEERKRLQAEFEAIPQEVLDAEAERRSAKGKAEQARIDAWTAEHGSDIEEEQDDD